MNRALAVGVGLLADRMFGEPPTPVHPVAWFGSTMQHLEKRLWLWPTNNPRHPRQRGVLYAASGVALGAASGWAVRSTAAVVGLCVAGRELRSVADRIGVEAMTGGLDAARSALPALVGRDPSGLDSSGIAAAVIESVAENSVDAVVAPVFWALLAGAPGAAAYRAINTMDAMVGHRSARYERFGTPAARLDDVANYVPARLFAGLMMLASPKSAAAITATVRRYAGAHPSPNAGVAESAMAAAIARQLGGPLRYGDRIEHRPPLGGGKRPEPRDIARATALADRAEQILTGSLLLVGGWRALSHRS